MEVQKTLLKGVPAYIKFKIKETMKEREYILHFVII